jgi:hypothetical protein
MNVYGRTHSQGKALDKDLRSLIVDTILFEGGDVTTGYYTGSFRAIERRLFGMTSEFGITFAKWED